MFRIVEDNPNALTGPGGCLCGEEGHAGCEGPYGVFVTTEMDSIMSPTPVVCAPCIRQLAEELEEFENDQAVSGPEV